MSISPYDLWCLSRLDSIEAPPSNDELVRVSDAIRPVAEQLARTPFADRPLFLNGFLLGRPDREAVIKAMADMRPDGPPPDPEAPSDPPPGSESGPRAKLIRAADIQAKPIDWLWRGRVPRGMLSMFAGDPKLGKSFATLGMAAAVSRGAPLPDGDPPEGPASVILLSAEDDPARTIAPRLRTAGADLRRVHILESVMFADGSEAWPSLARDIDAIEAAARALGDCRLIVIDPISAYLGGTDDHRNAELRSVLSPLKALAESLDAAVVLVTHLSKSGGTNGKHRVIGSIAYVGACRANFLFAKDRDDPTGRRVFMLDNGGNLAPPAPTLAYVIEDHGDGPRVEWMDETIDKDADTVLREIAEAQAVTADPTRQAMRRECEAWLRETLTAGPLPATEALKLARVAGYSQDQAKRAKSSIGIHSRSKGFGPAKVWYWCLGDDLPPDDEPVERTSELREQTP